MFAAHQLGAFYATGEGVGKDEVAARRWYGRGARRGDPESQWDLGFMLLEGEGGPADVATGIAWLERAAKGGSESAASLLSEIAREGLYGHRVDGDSG